MVTMITYFEIRLLKFIVYSLYGYLPEWSKKMYNEGAYEYEQNTDEYIMNFCSTGNRRHYKVIFNTAVKWIL